MEIGRLFYRIHALDESGNPNQFRGNAFPITPCGGLLTCKHVIAVSAQDAVPSFGIVDSHGRVVARVGNIIVSGDLDLAFLPDAIRPSPTPFIPLLTPEELLIGKSVYSFGFYSMSAPAVGIQQGYFAGSIVNFVEHSVVLPFTVLEGMSGSPILTYHNGPKLVGICYGNVSSRILAAEVVEVEDPGRQYKETIQRIVEFGRAYHCATISKFLSVERVEGFIVSAGTVDIAGLE